MVLRCRNFPVSQYGQVRNTQKIDTCRFGYRKLELGRVKKNTIYHTDFTLL